ncbi:MAG: GntR family transcriptional regulator [Hyphomicrobiaceae bacterium]
MANPPYVIARMKARSSDKPAGNWPSPVGDALVAAIMAGDLPAGAKLSEGAIGTIFNVSRTIVREALRQLASIGLVVLLPNRGAFVASPDAAEACDLYAARRLIELEIVADVASHCTAHDVRRLRQHVARQQAAYDQQNRGAYIHLLGEFHLVLAGIGGNRVLEELVGQLVPRSSLITTLFSGAGPHPCAMHEHSLLIDSLAVGDAAASVEAMREHLTLRSQSLEFEAPQPANIDFSTVLAPYVPGRRRARRP